MARPRLILHLDIDAFLASVEQIVEPALRGRPVVVGSGCVASRSYEAKARGVETAMAMSEARRRCPELVVRDGDARQIERFRARVAEILRGFVPVVEVTSLDDMYGDLTGVRLGARGPAALAGRVRAAVRDATGLSVAQGFGTCKTVARLATARAKPGGVLVVPPGGERAFLDPHPIEDLPGVGRASAELLRDLNVHTVADLRRVDRELLRRTFGKRGEDLFWRARGRDSEPVRGDRGALSISRETSFEGTGDRGFLTGLCGYLLDRAAAELRAQSLSARRVSVRVRFVDGVGREVARSLREPTDRTDLLLAVALERLEHLLGERRVLVRLCGVTLSVLTGRVRALRQGLLFAAGPSADAARRAELFTAVDAVRARHGFGKLVLGPATGLLGRLSNSDQGFRLRTPSLSL